MLKDSPRTTTDTGSIRTPDQRLRVFVSSTIKELAAERKAVRTAIERLRLAPVMFELGARPHPASDLYRAYLDQSDIFVGLYWESYGWVAPGEEVSGLEDEYLLSGSRPKLIYFKEPANGREPRLAELLDRVRRDGEASFKYFSTPRELGQLVTTDLATLLAERFDRSRLGMLEQHVDPTALPAPLTELIGRESDEQRVEALLRRDSVRLVTLIGPGGMGKSRLAIDVARKMAPEFPGGVGFVALAPVQDAAIVPTAIAQALGVRDTGVGTIEDKLATALRERRMLLVIDNFEQVRDAAPALTALLSGSPGLTLLVTSRSLLHVSGEHAFELGPLALPRVERSPSATEVMASPAVKLFVERARAVVPDLDVTVDNAESIARIVEALDGVPLAIELAAARIRMLPPAAMLARLDRRLPLLVGGVRDLPARQQTLRSTIEWSTQLLGDDEKHFLSLLGVFQGAFTLEAAEFLAEGHGDAMSSLGILLDNSLVRQQDHDGRSVFSMLSTVREYAREQLSDAGLLAAARARHAEYYVHLGATVELALEGARQPALITALADERDNIRAAARYLLDCHEYSTLTWFVWTLYIYWWIGGHLGEVRGWMEEILASGDELTELTRAITLYFIYSITFWQDPEKSVIPGLTESAELFHRADEPSGEALSRVSLALAMLSSLPPDPASADDELEKGLGLFRLAGDRWGESMALVTLGRVAIANQHIQRAINRFNEALDIARDEGDELATTIAQHHLGWASVLLGDIDSARSQFFQSLSTSARLRHDDGIAYGLEGLTAIAASTGAVERAGVLYGASQAVREQKGMYNAPTFSFHEPLLDLFRSGDQAGLFEEARVRGRTLRTDDAVALALS